MFTRLLTCFTLVSGSAAWAGETLRISSWDNGLTFDPPARAIEYTLIDKPRKPLNFCVSYPHLKDAYWLSVNYGMVKEAERLGVGFRLVEAGGYPNLSRQIEQIRECVRTEADALIVGSVSYDGLSETLIEIAQDLPVIAAVNDIAPAGITAKVGVPWFEMGASAGRIIAERHPKGSAPVRVGWFPGPKGAGWVRFVEQGFEAALEHSSAQIVARKFGDTGREIQVSLIEELLESGTQVDYLVGSAPMAEAAVSILRAQGLEDQIKVVSDYMTHAVFRGLRRGRILAAPTDSPIVQGRLAIELASRAVEGRLQHRVVGPDIITVRADSLSTFNSEASLAPSSFIPVFDLPARR